MNQIDVIMALANKTGLTKSASESVVKLIF